MSLQKRQRVSHVNLGDGCIRLCGSVGTDSLVFQGAEALVLAHSQLAGGSRGRPDTGSCQAEHAPGKYDHRQCLHVPRCVGRGGAPVSGAAPLEIVGPLEPYALRAVPPIHIIVMRRVCAPRV